MARFGQLPYEQLASPLAEVCKPYSDREKPSVSIILKALLMSFTTMYPFYKVVTSITQIDKANFVPCDKPCQYVKIFSAGGIPGTGVDIIQVQNGVSRPLYRHDITLEVQTAAYFKWKDQSASHVVSLQHDGLLHDIIKQQSVKDSWGYKISFWINKFLLRAFVYPFQMLSYGLMTHGVKHVVPASCANRNYTDMQALCNDPKVHANIDLGSLEDGLFVKSFYVSLFGWSQSIHDILLIHGVAEQYTILVGQLSTFFQGSAVFAIFFWAFSSFGVFGARVDDEESDCMCYYSMPVTAAVLALVTPASLLILFISKVQAVGMSILYGDYIYCARYDVPAYLVMQSKMWTWSTLVVPWVAGTPSYPRGTSATLISRQQANVIRRKLTSKGFTNDSPEDEITAYHLLGRIQSLLWMFRTFVWMVPVCLASCAAVLRGRLMLLDIIRVQTDWLTHYLFSSCMYLPVLFAGVYPFVFLNATFNETLPEFLRVKRHSWCVRCLGVPPELGSNFKSAVDRARNILFTPIALFEIVTCSALVYGLFPTTAMLWSGHQTILADAEMYSASGFVLVAIPLQQALMSVFSCREDLLKIQKFDARERSTSGEHTLTYGRTSDYFKSLERSQDDIDGFGLKVDAYGNTEFIPASASRDESMGGLMQDAKRLSREHDNPREIRSR